MASPTSILQMIRENDVKFVSLRVTDMHRKISASFGWDFLNT